MLFRSCYRQAAPVGTWQIECVSLTQAESHELVQQNESTSQIFFTQGSQREVSAAPVVQ